MTKQIKDNTCENCRYYLGYHVKRNTGYAYIHSGHCVNPNNKDRKKREPVLCELWENTAAVKEERKKNIIETLRFMSQRLDEMLMIFKDDAEH